jgi:hypothetical protein
MVKKKNSLTDALKLATAVFVSIPFLATTTMAAPCKRAKKTDIRGTKTGVRFSQPGLRAKDPKKRIHKPGVRAMPGARPTETGVRLSPKDAYKASDQQKLPAPVIQVK